MIVDAHQHFWRLGAHDCAWPTPDLEAIHRDFLPGEFKAASEGLGVSQSVLVQSQPSDRDTDWLITLGAETETIGAVVGWADLAAPDAPARIAALAQQPKLRGLRPMLQGLPEDDWILRADVAPAIEAMVAHGLSFDALVFTRHLPHLARFADIHPRLSVVIDHCAKPPIAAREFEPWAEQISAMAKRDNVFCKVSGLLTEAGPSPNAGMLAPYVAHVIKCFGAERVMWGSDWPVLNLAGAYGDWLEMARALSGLKGAALDLMLGGVARQFYRL